MPRSDWKKAREVIRPGITELQLAGAIEAAMRDAGSEYPAMPVWIWSGPRGIGHKTPDHRPLQTGDCVGMEFAGVHRRYHAVTMQTVAVRSAPASYQKSYNRALSSLRAGASVIAPGVPVSRSEQAAIDDLVSNGADPRYGHDSGTGFPSPIPPLGWIHWTLPWNPLRSSSAIPPSFFTSTQRTRKRGWGPCLAAPTRSPKRDSSD